MKKEVSPLTMAIVGIVILAAIVLLFWKGTTPAGVKTAKPPKPNPPTGAMPAEPKAPQGGIPAPPE
ncbi:MAG TPA: hypothetical protein VFB38_16920 [Chthonomonadaceae bacterium]|nr:hypothetical protein [Chthonomonadaceae bacterium]